MKEEKTRSVEVILMGQAYRFTTAHTNEHVKKIESIVNKEIQSLKEQKPSAPTLDIVMLSAMNIANKYVQNIEEQKAQVDSLLEKSDKLMDYIDKRLTDQ